MNEVRGGRKGGCDAYRAVTHNFDYVILFDAWAEAV